MIVATRDGVVRGAVDLQEPDVVGVLPGSDGTEERLKAWATTAARTEV